MKTSAQRKVEQPSNDPTTATQGDSAKPQTSLTNWQQRILIADNGIVEFDLRHIKSHTTQIWHRDLNDVLLFGGVDSGVYSGKVIKLGAFPHLVEALTTALLSDLQAKHKGRPDTTIPLLLGTSTRIFCWMLSSNHYRLSDLTRSKVEELIKRLARAGWYEVLNMEKVLGAVVEKASATPDIAVTLMPSGNSTSPGLNLPALRMLTGLPFSGPEVPIGIRKQLFSLAGRAWPEQSTLKAAGYPAGSAIETTMESLNRLSLHQQPGDCLHFLPFPSINSSAAELGKKPGQTPNLSLDDALRVFKACVSWLYERAPKVVEIAHAARAAFEDRTNDGLRDRAVDDRGTKAVRDAASRLLSSAPADQEWLNADELTLSRGKKSLACKIVMTQVAAACTIGINHGRRTNEVVGEDLPYGIYFGCVRPVANLLHDWRIDIYCEKGSQDYRSFPANALVSDAVSCLEQLANVLRPLNTPALERSDDIKVARTRRLFTLRDLSVVGFQKSLYDIPFRTHLNEFLGEAGVSPKSFVGSSWPFRRLFAVLNANRYDNHELLALSDHLDHLGVPSTRPYITDFVDRPGGTSIKEQMNQHDLEEEAMLQEMRQANIEHLSDKIERLLNGEAIGGLFPRLILRLAKKLAARTDFRTADTTRKVHTLTDILVRHGYTSNPMRHTNCVADKPRATIRLANCYRDGELHREDACEKKCNGCVHAMPAPTQIDRLRQLSKQANSATKDENLPSAVRKSASDYEALFARLAAAEEAIAQENKAMFERLMTAWTEEVLCHGQ